MDELHRAVEALIFAADEAISAASLAAIINEVRPELDVEEERVGEIVDTLNTSYEETGRSFRIHRWAGGYRMATEPDVSDYLDAHFAGMRERSLSRSLMEALAIVAYKQPVTKPEVDHVRGVDSGYALRKLLEQSLLEVRGRDDSVGRPLLYGTTDYFLEQFGLESLEDLPSIREIEELLEDPEFEEERAELFLAEGIENTNGNPGEEEPTNGQQDQEDAEDD